MSLLPNKLKKYKTFIVIIIILLLTTSNAYATLYFGYFGTAGLSGTEKTLYMYADSVNNDDFFTSIKFGAVGNTGHLIAYQWNGVNYNSLVYDVGPGEEVIVNLPELISNFQLYNDNATTGETYAVYSYDNNPLGGYVVYEESRITTPPPLDLSSGIVATENGTLIDLTLDRMGSTGTYTQIFYDGVSVWQGTPTSSITGLPTPPDGTTILIQESIMQDGESVVVAEGSIIYNSTGGTDSDYCDIDILENMLLSPYYQQFLGDILPPPPDWDYITSMLANKIAATYTDLANIIADELQNREKQVQPPPTINNYIPPYSLPTLTDLAAPIDFDLTQGVPNFTPNYDNSKPFTFLDPGSWDQTDYIDSGYIMPAGTDNSSINYNKTENIDTDIGYSAAASTITDLPDYSNTNIIADDNPTYTTVIGNVGNPPIYNTPISGDNPSYITGDGSTVIPNYIYGE